MNITVKQGSRDSQLADAIKELRAKRVARAKELLIHLLSQHPDFAPALHYLGLTEYELGHKAEGLDLLQRALTIMPDNIMFIDNTSYVLTQENALEDAGKMLHHALSIDPRHPQLWNRLGEIFYSYQGYVEADQCFINALHVDKNYKNAVLNLAESLRIQQRMEDAVELVRPYIESMPNDGDMLDQYSSLLMQTGKVDEAVKILDAAAQRGHTQANLYHLLGTAYSYRGDFETSRVNLLKAMQLNPEYTRSLVLYSAITKFTPSDPAISQMRDAYQRLRDLPDSKVNLCFSLGKAMDDIGSYDEAFDYYREGNNICRLQQEQEHRAFSAPVQDKYNSDMIAAYNAVSMRQLPSYSPSPVTPIFVLGMSRSGTTLTEQILSSHPEVTSGGELTILNAELSRLLGYKDLRNPTAMGALSSDALVQIRNDYLAYIHKISGGRRFVTDKLPGNFLRIGLLQKLFPEAPLVYSVRDAVDNCLSCYFTMFGSGHEFSYDFEDLAAFYKGHQKIMAHWFDVVRPGSLTTVKYEELTANPEEVIRGILEHCTLPWNADCLNFHKSSRTIRTSSVYQARQPIYKGSVQRWRRYEKHLVPLIKALYS